MFRHLVPLGAIRRGNDFFLLKHGQAFSIFGDGPRPRSPRGVGARGLFFRRSLMFSTRLMIPDLLTVREVARRLSISERTVWRWTALGLLPPPVHPHARSTRWRAADIVRFLEGLSAHSGPGEHHG